MSQENEMKKSTSLEDLVAIDDDQDSSSVDHKPPSDSRHVTYFHNTGRRPPIKRSFIAKTTIFWELSVESCSNITTPSGIFWFFFSRVDKSGFEEFPKSITKLVVLTAWVKNSHANNRRELIIGVLNMKKHSSVVLDGRYDRGSYNRQ